MQYRDTDNSGRLEMTHIIKIESREEIPDFCYKAGETLAENRPAGRLAELLSNQPVVWVWKQARTDDYGAFKMYVVYYYIPAPD